MNDAVPTSYMNEYMAWVHGGAAAMVEVLAAAAAARTAAVAGECWACKDGLMLLLL